MSKPNFNSLSKLLELDLDERRILFPLSRGKLIRTSSLQEPDDVAGLLEKLYNRILAEEVSKAKWQSDLEEQLKSAQKALDGDSNDAEHDALNDLVQFLS